MPRPPDCGTICNVKLYWGGAERPNVGTRYDIEKARTANPFAADLYDVGAANWLTAVLGAEEVPEGEDGVRRS